MNNALITTLFLICFILAGCTEDEGENFITTPLKLESNVTGFSVSYSNIFVVKEDNTLWGAGENRYGQLGLGDTVSRYGFTLISDSVNNVASGGEHTVFTKLDGSAMGTGDFDGSSFNLTGKLLYPIRLTDDCKRVYAGRSTSFFLKNDNSLWALGDNSKGALGINSTFSNTPEFVKDDIIHVAPHNYYTSYIFDIHSNMYRLGYPGKNENEIDSRAQNDEHILIDKGIADYSFGNVGVDLLLQTDGKLYGTSSVKEYFSSATSLESTTQWILIEDSISSITSDFYTIFYIKNDGSLWGTGKSQSGELGIGFRQETSTPQLIDKDVVYAEATRKTLFYLKSDGTFWCLGGEKGYGVVSYVHWNTNY